MLEFFARYFLLRFFWSMDITISLTIEIGSLCYNKDVEKVIKAKHTAT